ncbi:MAG TPA: proline dehydrogenase family protein [Candidatus Bathyarchaeia archaeon]|nr:proline dehydrogenase family protein [Candidatus Bathyarchaeia archaeon]
MMNELESRWALPDLQSTVAWCSRRNAQNIRCIIDVLGEYARKESQAAGSVEAYMAAAKSISDNGLDASLTVKLSALGALFDQERCRQNVQTIAREAGRRGVGFELDMEGQGLITYTIDVAAACAEKGRVSLALQAYLDRSRDDVLRVSESGIIARLVKGAYVGSTTDFADIQKRFKQLSKILCAKATFFSVGTHDPDLIEWITRRMEGKRDLIEFGFLKGLADRTKVEMAQDGWLVSEYVPFGDNCTAYEARRRKYLKELESLGRTPTP